MTWMINHLQDHRKAACGARRPDALGGHRFRHMKALDAEREHRRARVLGPQLTLVDLGDGSEQLRSVPLVLTDEVSESMEKLSFREICERVF